MTYRMQSLRVRLLIISAGIVVLALFVTAIGLTELFERHSKRRVAQELDVYLTQLSGAIRFDADQQPFLIRDPADPRFNTVFGGLYWQIGTDQNDILLRSRSLWDSEISLPQDTLVPGETHQHSLETAFSRALLVREQMITIPTAGTLVDVRVSVAVDSVEIERLAVDFRKELIPALALLGIVLLAGFGFQIAAGLKPLGSLQASVNKVRSGKQSRLTADVPREVKPLVDEVNALLELQGESMIRARDRAADLAHGFKTPLTALATDIARLQAKGETQIAADIEDVAMRMKRLMERELAQARIRHGGRVHSASLNAATAAILRTLERTPRGETIQLTQDIPDHIDVAMDRDDLNEVLGNLLENALRHARSLVHVTAACHAGRAVVEITDDGVGLSKEQSDAMVKRGARMDVKGTGTGLGLAIVQDILDASKGSMTLKQARGGGLKVVLDLPMPSAVAPD